MEDLENKFYKILESHNHEIVMDFVWLVNLAHELAEAAKQEDAKQIVQSTLITDIKNHCVPINGVHAPFCTGHKS